MAREVAERVGLDAPEAWLQARRDAWARRLDSIKELAEEGGD